MDQLRIEEARDKFDSAHTRLYINRDPVALAEWAAKYGPALLASALMTQENKLGK